MKSKSRTWISAGLFSGVLLFAGPLWAQDKEDAAGSDICIADAICRAHYSRARKLSKKDDYEGAIEAYEAAYRRKPAQWLLINMGRTLHKLGRTQDAIDQYRRYLESEDANAELRKKAEQFLREAETDLASRPKKDPAKAPTDPAATGPGNLPPSSGGGETPGSSSSVAPKTNVTTPDLKPFVVEPVAPPSYKEPPPSRLGPLFYGGLAVGGALIVGGAITGILGLTTAKTLQTTPYAGSVDASTLPDLQNRVRGLGYATDVMIPLGVATVAVATIVSLARKPAEAKSATTVPATPPAAAAPVSGAVAPAAPAPPAPSATPAAAPSVTPAAAPSVTPAAAPAAPNVTPSETPNTAPNPTP